MIQEAKNDLYFINGRALSFTENDLGDPNRIAVSLVSGTRIMVYKKGVIDYAPDLEPEKWTLKGYSTLLAKKDPHSIYARLSRLDRTALLVFSVRDYNLDGSVNTITGVDEDGKDIIEVSEPSEEFYYVKIGSVTGTDRDAGDPGIATVARNITYDSGILNSSQDIGIKLGDWSSLFVPHYDDPKDPTKLTWIEAKSHMGIQGGVTMFIEGEGMDLPSIYDGLPIDNDTIYWEEIKDEEGNVIGKRIKARGGSGEGGITPTLLGDLTNVGSWANDVAIEDRIMVQRKGSSSWVALNLSEIGGGSADFSNVTFSGNGNAFTSFTLSEDKKTLTFVKGQTFALQNELDKKWTTDNAKIENWDTAYGWGDHSKVGYAKTDDVTDELKKYVTLGGKETITGEKDFTGGLKVNGSQIVYDKTNKYWKLTGDLLVTGGITMYANDGTYTPSTIMDAIAVDNHTIVKQNGKLMVNPELVFGGGEGGEVSTVAWGNIIGTPSWITDTKPKYSYTEISGTPDLSVYATKGATLAHYGIADAKISNGVITLGNNTITPLTQTLGDARYVTALGTSGNDLTWTKNGTANKITVPYATHSAHTSYLRNYLGDYNSITDLNEPSTFKTSQYRVVYDFYDGNTANRPVTSNNASGVLTLFKGIHRTGGGQYMSQMAFPDKDAVYFRRASDGVFGDWKQFAFTDSDITGNADTATALKNSRTLWGQSFDGTENVSGDMTGVGSLTMDGQLSLNGITIKRSASGVLFIDGNLVVSGGVTMYGTDGTTSTTIWNNAPIANTQGKKGVASYDPNYFAVNNGVVTFVGQTGGGIESITKQMVIDALGYTPYDASNPNNYVTSSGTVANATNLTSYKAVTLTKSDNGGKPCYLLIADVTSWYSASASSYEWGIAGIMYGWRGGNLSGTCVQKMIAMCSYNKSNYELKSDVITYVKPRIVSYGGKYYIALYMAGSGRSHYFIGKTSRLLDDFIEVACDSNGNCDGLAVVFDTEVMAMGGASVGELTTKRKIWGQDFDGSSDVSGAITGATTGSFSGNVSMASATINGGKLTYNSTDKYWKLEGDLLVTGGVTMFGSDSSFNPSTITQAVNVDGTTIINDGTKLMLNPNIELGGGGVTDYNDLTGKPDLSVYALKTSLSSYQTKITSTNKLSYSLIEGTPTSLKNPNTLSWNGYSSGSYDGSSKETISIPSNTNQLTNGAGFITSSGSITGNAATATTASKLSTVSKTAWGQTYWTSGGVPTNISGNMSSVGNITFNADAVQVGSWGKGIGTIHANVVASGGSNKSIWIIGSNASSDYGIVFARNETGSANGEIARINSTTFKPYTSNGLSLGTSSNLWKEVWTSGIKFNDSKYLSFSSSSVAIGAQSGGSQLIIDSTSVRTNTTESYKASLGTNAVPWNALCLGVKSVVNNQNGINYCDANGYVVSRVSCGSSGLGLYSKGSIYLRGGCTQSSSDIVATTNGLVLDDKGNVTISGNLLVGGGVTMYAATQEQPIANFYAKEINIEGYADGRRSRLTNGGSYIFFAPVSGAWASGWSIYKNDGTTSIGSPLGAYGTGGTLDFFYYGGTYNEPWLKLQSTSLSGNYWKINDTSSNPYIMLEQGSKWYIQGIKNSLCLGASEANSFKINSDGSASLPKTLTQGSDIRFKDIHKELLLSLETVADAPSIEYHFTDDESKSVHIGTSAQYWQSVNGVVSEGEDGRLGMDYSSLGVVIGISLAKELSRYERGTDKEIQTLKKRIGELEEEIENLKNK